MKMLGLFLIRCVFTKKTESAKVGFWKFVKTGTGKNRGFPEQCVHCLFWFDLPIRKEEGKFKQGTKYVRQGFSKVFVFFTYSRVTQQNLNDSTEWKCPHCGLEWRAVLSCYWYTLHNVLLTEWLMWDLLIFGLVYAVVTWWNNVKYGWV